MSKREEKRRMSLSNQHKDNAETMSLLQKLTPKLIKSSSELAGRQDGVDGAAQPGKSADESDLVAAGSSADDVPDWYEELSEDHVSAFKEVFDMLDSSHTGTLNADSLFEGLRRVDSEITREEVEDVLKKLDKDGNGVIDFDEFLFHISHGAPDSQDDDENTRKRRPAFTKRQRLFYSAITEFHLKRTLVAIQRAQMAKVNQPHVLRHYTAGARLIGLTDRQLANEMKRMQKNMKQQDSPYAKPLQLVVSARGHKTVKKAIRPRGHKKSVEVPTAPSQVAGQISQMKQAPPQVPVAVPSAGPMAVSIRDANIMSVLPRMAHWAGVATKIRSLVPKNEEVSEEIRETMSMLTSRAKVVAKLPDVHKILEMKEKLAQDMAGVKETDSETPLAAPVTSTSIARRRSSTPPLITPITPSPPPIATSVTPTPSPPTPPPVTTSPTPDKARKHKTRGQRTVTGWKIPRVDRDKVPLPVLKIKYKLHRPTIEDLPNIREKASQAIDDYYESLRKATVKNAWDHWDKLYSHRIRSHKLMDNFREVYRAYSPHKEEEAFVVCPWIPGPFRHIKHNIRCYTAGYVYPHHSAGRQRPTSRQQASPTDHRLPSGRTSRSSGGTSCTENRPVSAI